VVYIPKPEVPHVRGSLMFLNLEDVIHHNQSTLWYHVLIDILEVEDWNDPSDSSDDSSTDANGGPMDPQRHCWIQSWPKKTHFNDDSSILFFLCFVYMHLFSFLYINIISRETPLLLH
jgi:hypothetical protein